MSMKNSNDTIWNRTSDLVQSEQAVTKAVRIAKRDSFLSKFSCHKKYFAEFSEINLRVRHTLLY
jgi:hypothetical protein